MITQQQIEVLRKTLHDYIDACIDSLLFDNVPPIDEQPALQGEFIVKVVEKVPDTFLDDVNAPIPLSADEQEKTPDIPSDDELTEILDKTKEVEKDETPQNFIQRDSKEFLALAEFSMLKGWQKSNVDNFLLKKGLALSAKNEDVLNELRKFGAMVKADEMTVTALLGQNCLSEIEVAFLTTKYLF